MNIAYLLILIIIQAYCWYYIGKKQGIKEMWEKERKADREWFEDQLGG